MIVKISNPIKWLAMQVGMLVLATGLISLCFNYAYRLLVDRNINETWFYVVTLVMGLVTFVAFRKDYIFVSSYEFTAENIVVRTLLGVTKVFPLDKYRFVPHLHKAINFPQPKASLAFYVRDAQSGKNVRNYPWAGFPKTAFVEVSRMYGYKGETDFDLRDIGKP